MRKQIYMGSVNGGVHNGKNREKFLMNLIEQDGEFCFNLLALCFKNNEMDLRKYFNQLSVHSVIDSG